MGLLAVTVMSLAACSASASSPSVATLLGAGTTEYRQGAYDAAAQLFQQALKKAPDDATAYFDLGSVYQAEHMDQQALQQYAMALRDDPDLSAAVYNQATIYASKNVPLAIFLYRKVISMQADSPTAYLNLGLLEAQQGQKAGAGVHLREAVKLDPVLRANIPAADAADLSLPPPHAITRSAPPSTLAP